jgi:hypothetical protein
MPSRKGTPLTPDRTFALGLTLLTQGDHIYLTTACEAAYISAAINMHSQPQPLALDPTLVAKKGCSRFESGHLVVDRHILPLYPHRVIAPEIDAVATVEPTADRKLLEFHACLASHATATQQAAHSGAPLGVADDDEVLSVPADVVEARHGQCNVARMFETRARVDLRLLHAGRLWAPGRQVVQVEHAKTPEA